jgi:pyrimidine and pyridine-specific 5'-nucleotidase
VASLQANHSRQLNHYKNLLVRAQSASSSSLHDLHSRLHRLEGKYAALEAEHEKCAERRKQERGKRDVEDALRAGKGIEGILRGMGKSERIKLLGTIAEGTPCLSLITTALMRLT